MLTGRNGNGDSGSGSPDREVRTEHQPTDQSDSRAGMGRISDLLWLGFIAFCGADCRKSCSICDCNACGTRIWNGWIPVFCRRCSRILCRLWFYSWNADDGRMHDHVLGVIFLTFMPYAALSLISGVQRCFGLRNHQSGTLLDIRRTLGSFADSCLLFSAVMRSFGILI